MKALYEPLCELKTFNQLTEALKNKKSPVLASGVIDSQKNHLVWGVQKFFDIPSLIITYSELKAKEIFDDMQFFLKDKIRYYPAKDIIFYSADVKSVEITKKRFETICSLIENEDISIVVSIEALFDRLIDKDIFKSSILDFEIGDECKIDSLIKKLVYIGYERCDMVEGHGQFSIRGGIIDLFSSNSENIYRIELWGDEIDSIRLVDKQTQRSVDKIEKIKIYPMRELIYDETQLQKVIEKIQKEFDATYSNYIKKGLHEEAERLRQIISETLENLTENNSFNGIDKYTEYFYENNRTLLDYLSPNTLIVFDEPQRIAEHSSNVLYEFHESIKNRILKGYMLPKQMDMVFSYAHILKEVQNFPVLLFTTLTTTMKDFAIKEICNFSIKSTGIIKNQINMLVEDLKYLCDNNYRILILAGAKSRGERIHAEIESLGINSAFYENIEDLSLQKGRVIVSKGSLNKGFEYQHINVSVITDKEIFGEEKRKKALKKKKKGSKIESFLDLKVGDYVVHDSHGIGIYKGIEKITVEGINRDYLKLSYSDGGSLYVPTNQLDLVQKYVGGESGSPKLNKLGGTAWDKAKTKTRNAVKILAKDLLLLYAKRESQKGFIYSCDNVWQTEFEESFPFEETDDQLTAIADVKQDMESGKVMDRLICGDVGYGKTEIAIRAAFKAVQDGKQVAYLVPTTILAQQHYNTFLQRMSNFPIGVELLSRFRSMKSQKESINRLETGLSDIVIGTHRILSKDLTFKDLGLVIIDEEQRFGVAHKEKLKHLKANIDVLTLTATPIPRTLHMSLSGIRDMSVLEEPPHERQPVQTYVMEYSQEFVRDAIHRELARNGQVYYLHNRVVNIEEVAKKVQGLVPEASVAYAHGQMSERELENVMKDFIDGEINVLVCTTIIETGLDISNVNTIIIQDADRMGLSQLYQLRGRVGRSNKLAYAYLMYKKDKVLNEIATKRLQAIREFTEFGSGFKIAMRDLEIRGAGSLLGGEQHGHMDTVGYDMYCKLLARAVKELKGEIIESDWITHIDLNINAYIPLHYIEDEEQKLEIYKKISSIQTEKDFFDMQEEIEDRFGNLPDCVQNLLDVALLKSLAHSLRVVSIAQKGRNIIITFKNDIDLESLQIEELVKEHKNKFYFTAKPVAYLTYKMSENETLPPPMIFKGYLQCLKK